MRKSEQYGLAWVNVNTSLHVLTVPRSKSGEVRHIPLNSAALDALAALRKLHPDSSLVCGGGKAPFWFRRALRRVCVANLRWHDLRHTFASRLTMAGVPSRTVLELLGDKTPAMILRYAHLSFEHELEAVEKLARMSGPENEVPPELPPIAKANSDEDR
jgi:integrase